MKQIFGAVFAAVLALTFAPAALAHATITPEAVAPHTRTDFTLRLREEVEGARTERVEMTVPHGFTMQATANDPEWRIHTAGRAILWTGRGEPVFHFTGTPGDAGDYAFKVRQYYSNEAVMDWAGDHDSERPAAVVRVSEDGGLPTFAIVVFAIGGLAILAGVVALLARNRSLA
jgi:uncharacterized protein YcnI